MEKYESSSNDHATLDIDIFPDLDSLFTPDATTTTTTTSSPITATEHQSVTAENRLYQARLIIESQLYEDLLNQYSMALAQLNELNREIAVLQEENERLRIANEELIGRVGNLLLESCLTSPTALAEEFSRLDVGRDHVSHVSGAGNEGLTNSSPTSVIDQSRGYPKCMSVRSRGYMKNKSNSLGGAGGQLVLEKKLNTRKEEKETEMEVYKQGTYKTELCNKWKDTGTCPYGPHCQFAHGVSELRPVLRHPRYKTQLCRMVTSGLPCPYGHRCHFRHTISHHDSLKY